MKFFLIFLVVIFNISAHFLFKLASKEISSITFFTLVNWKLILGGALQIVALISWIKLLQNVELYWAALMSAIIPLGLVLLSVFVFNENLNFYKILGAVFIVSGLIILNI